MQLPKSSLAMSVRSGLMNSGVKEEEPCLPPQAGKNVCIRHSIEQPCPGSLSND